MTDYKNIPDYIKKINLAKSNNFYITLDGLVREKVGIINEKHDDIEGKITFPALPLKVDFPITEHGIQSIQKVIIDRYKPDEGITFTVGEIYENLYRYVFE